MDQDPFELLAQLRLTEEELGRPLLLQRPPTGFDIFTATLVQVEAVAALVAPPGRKAEAARIVRSLLTQRAARYAPPQSEALNPTPEADR